MSGEDERQFARALIAGVLEEHARTEITAGRAPAGAQEEEELAAAVHAALFGVGRLQPLLDDPQIENIDINGCDRVFLSHADGREVMADPVAESDEELVELIQALAAYSGLSSRPFDTANPQLDVRLPDGSRLSAVMDVTVRPAVSIRRARLGKVFLSDLAGNGTISPEVASFLAAADRRAEEPHDRRGHERGQDHAAAGDRERDPARRAADHGGAGARARHRPFPRPAPERARVRGAAAQLRGPGRDLHGRAGPPLAADEPEPGDRRGGARRRDRHHAQRDDPGQRRLAVHHPRQLLAGGVQPDRHLRDPVGRTPAGRGDPHAHRRGRRLRDLH